MLKQRCFCLTGSNSSRRLWTGVEYSDNKGARGCWQRIKCVDVHVCAAAGRGRIVNLNRSKVSPTWALFSNFLAVIWSYCRNTLFMERIYTAKLRMTTPAPCFQSFLMCFRSLLHLDLVFPDYKSGTLSSPACALRLFFFHFWLFTKFTTLAISFHTCTPYPTDPVDLHTSLACISVVVTDSV